MKISKITATLALLMSVIIAVSCNQAPQTTQGGNQPADIGTSTNVNGGIVDNQPTPVITWPILSDTKPDPTEVQAVEKVITHTFVVESDVSRSFDVTELAEVFVDDSAVPASDKQTTFIHQVSQAQGSLVAERLKGDGFLTYMTAFYLNWKRGAEGWDRIEAQAKAEGREVTAEDVSSITGTVGEPWRRNPPSTYKNDPAQVCCDFRSIKIEGSYADVTYYGGNMLVRAFLVKASDGWKVAARRTLNSNG